MKNIFILLTFCLALLSISCHEDLHTSTDPTYFGEGFHGITFTSSGGPTSHGPIDPSDWCHGFSRGMYKTADDSTGVIEEPIPAPVTFSFGPAYPNPTDGTANVRFSIPQRARVKVYLINANYEVVQMVINEEKAPGTYQIIIGTRELPGGVYRAVIEAGDYKCTGDIWVYRLKS